MDIAEKTSVRLSGTGIKLLAIIIMLIDHIGAVVVERGILQTANMEKFMQILETDSGNMWYMTDMCLRTIGRVAFPLFAFLLVEGFLHTRNAGRYLLNLTLFALVSEIPFDIAVMGGRGLEFTYQNVYFTLAIGLLMMMGFKRYEYRKNMQVLTFCLCGGLSLILRTDYSIIGILLIAIFYLFRDNRKYKYIAAGLLLFFESFFYFGTAALSLVLIHHYSGERGKTQMKYLFYAFYPVHLLILAGIRYLVFQTM